MTNNPLSTKKPIMEESIDRRANRAATASLFLDRHAGDADEDDVPTLTVEMDIEQMMNAR
jgi:hypothetical protein